MLVVAGTWIHFKGLDTVTLILCSTVITFPGKITQETLRSTVCK